MSNYELMGSIQPTAVLAGEVAVPKTVKAGSGGTTNHAQLTNRDAADQHPISAISSLQDALDGKQPKGNYITEETDPTVPSWAKAKDKPTYTAAEVNALPADTKIPSKLSEMEGDTTHRVVTDAEKAAWNAKSEFSGKYADLEDKPTIPTVPVQSVNGKTGAVVLNADDVGARPNTWMPTAAEVGARPSDWMPTADEIGAAPSGYGLGTITVSLPIISDMNAPLLTGWYHIGNTTTNFPIINGISYASGTLFVTRDGTNHWQTFYSRQNKNVVIQRTGTGDSSVAWEEWEWISPPLTVGVEYRTSKRYKGQVVYMQVIDLGELPQTAGKAVDHNIKGCRPISCTARTTSSCLTIPYTSSSGARLQVGASTTNITVYASYNHDNGSGTVQALIKYYKV